MHLMPLRPCPPTLQTREAALDNTVGPVSAAPFGSASILTISWMYIRMMGARGLADATKVAILNANYLAKRRHAYHPLHSKCPGGRGRHGSQFEWHRALRRVRHDWR